MSFTFKKQNNRDGHQSPKAFTPGQQKKKNGTTVVVKN
jgi:hypothetical protein